MRHHPARLPILLTAGALAFATAATAAVGSWSPLGPDGESIYALAADPVNPNLVYAATPTSVFGSSDGGASWQRLPSPATVPASPESIRWAIVASPVAPLTLYANLNGLESDVVYRSRDAGATWQAVGGSVAPGSFGIRSLAVDPHDPRRLLAGTAKRGIFTFTEP